MSPLQSRGGPLAQVFVAVNVTGHKLLAQNKELIQVNVGFFEQRMRKGVPKSPHPRPDELFPRCFNDIGNPGFTERLRFRLSIVVLVPIWVLSLLRLDRLEILGGVSSDVFKKVPLTEVMTDSREYHLQGVPQSPIAIGDDNLDHGNRHLDDLKIGFESQFIPVLSLAKDEYDG